MYDTIASDVSSIPATVTFLSQQGNERTSLEQFIHDVYAKQYCADIKHYMPLLMGLHAKSGSYLAALGLRFASTGPLFLEQYLEQPIETILPVATHYESCEISRSTIVEVGNLAAHHAGGTRWLIIALTAYLQGAGYDWVAFTSVPSLRNSFRKLGLKLFNLGAAEQARLPQTEQANWGRYYETRPQVMAVNVNHTYGVLERLLRFEQALTSLQQIWQQSFAFGHADQIQTLHNRVQQHAR